MKTHRIGILFLLLTVCASAQTPVSKKEVRTPDEKSTNHSTVLTWALPNTCSDGTPCTPTGINVYKLVGTCGAPTTQFTKIASLSGTTKTYTDGNLAAATTFCYYVTALIGPPPAWDSTVTYTGGQTVSYSGGVYVALNNLSPNLNQIPTSSPSFWGVSSVESAASNTASGSTGTMGPPAPPSNLTATIQ